MSKPLPENVKAWLAEPMPSEVFCAIERIARAPDVRHVAVMPDVHLARDVCVGVVVATEDLIYPAAVGTDIGCGIASVAFHGNAALLNDEQTAGRLLQRLREAVPIHRHHRAQADDLPNGPLSDDSIDRIRKRDGAVQFGTLGRGNHFLEFQADEEDRLWLMVHSGSRAMGRAIREFHEKQASPAPSGLRFLDARTPQGEAYLSDAQWACEYARAGRRAMARAVAAIVREMVSFEPDNLSYFDCTHNQVSRETHFGRLVWVHRKGAIAAPGGEAGMIPGSMGTQSFHVTGRGNAQSLCSASHGAGRAMSRDEARRRVSAAELLRQMSGVSFDARRMRHLTEEAPTAYKDVRAVLRAESELVRIVRRLRPVLSYKGT